MKLELQDLQKIPAFKAAPELAEKLYEYSIVKEYPEGHIILNEDGHIKSIPIVTRGILRVIRTEEDGREILLYYLQPGESCVMSFLGGLHDERSKVRVEVEEDAEILFLPISRAGWLVKEFPEWVDYVFRLYHRRFEELLDTVNDIAFKKVDERLLSLLQKKSIMTKTCIIPVTHEQLANELGTSRVVISRLLKKLEEMDLVKLGRNKIELLDKKNQN